MTYPAEVITRITRLDVPGHLRIVAGVVVVALYDARAGDSEAARWLGSECCRGWLAYISGDIAPETIQAQLVAAAGVTVSESAGVCRQLEMFGVAA